MNIEEEVTILKDTVKKQGNTIERHSDRLATIEQNLSQDHKVLESVQEDVDEMKTKINTMEKDVRTIKAQSLATNNSLSKLTAWVKIAIVVAIIAFGYSVIRNEKVVSGLATLSSVLLKLGLPM